MLPLPEDDGHLQRRISGHYCHSTGTVPAWCHEDVASWVAGAWVRHYMLTNNVPAGLEVKSLDSLLLISSPSVGIVDRSSPSGSSNGKPRVKGFADFNISHSGGWVAGALGDAGCRVGVDVCRVGWGRAVDLRHPFPQSLPLPVEVPMQDSNLFTEGEREWIAKKRCPTRFFSMWALNEAFLKCIGMGWAGKWGSAVNGLESSIRAFECIPSEEPVEGSFCPLRVVVRVGRERGGRLHWEELLGWRFDVGMFRDEGSTWIVAHCRAKEATVNPLFAPP